jgi:O-antigen/teichoic acid export membrane protein
MSITITHKDILWGYGGYFFKTASNVIILPFILKFLPTKELGLWYTFTSIGVLVTLLDFGFLPTIMRNISYCWSGAEQLQEKGLQVACDIGKPNYLLLKKVIIASRRIYLLISLLAFFLLSTVGTIYIKHISLSLNGNSYLIAWGIYCIGIFLNLYYSYWTPFLNGIGAIKEGQKALVVSRFIQIIIAITGLYMNYGLLAIAISFLLSGLSLREISRFYFYRRDGIREELKKVSSEFSKNEFVKIFSTIWYNAWRLGIVSFGAFLITQANTLVCSSFFGLEMTAKYGLSLQLFGIVGAFSGVVFNSYLPVLNESSLINDSIRAKKIISIAACTSWLSYLIAALIAICFGDFLLNIIGSRSSLLPKSMLIIMSVYLFLEFNHSMFATVITTENQVPFVWASVVSGVAILTISLILAFLTHWGILGILLTQGIVQLAYNNWRWPLWVKKKYNLKLKEMFTETYLVLRSKMAEEFQ